MRALLFLCLICSFSIQAKIQAAEIRVASAANFYHTLNKIKNQFEAQTGHKVTIIRGSTGKLYSQIMYGAPYDLFLSADSKRAEKLVQQGKAMNDRVEVYAIGQVVLWRPDSDSSQELHDKLVEGKFKKLAIANPKTAPYGRAAIEALKSMEIYAEVKPKLVYAENIAQALQFVQSGAADLGLVARAHVNHDIFWEVDTYQHKPIAQKMLVLKQSKQKDVANSFYEFIKSEAALSIIKADGYRID